MTDKRVEAAKRALNKLHAEDAGGCFAPSGVDTPDDCVAGTCYCARQCEREAKAALAAVDAEAWQPIEEISKDQVIDVWLGDADESDVEFYCTPGTRRSPGWHWVQGKWRPIQGLSVLTVFVQPTHGRPLPAAPAVKP